MMKRFFSILFCLLFLTSVSFGGFADVTTSVGLDVYSPAGDDVSAAWGDYNDDGDVDLYIAALSTTSNGGVFTNNSGMFTGEPNSGPGADHSGLWVDYDNDGDLDLYTTQAGAHASRNDGGGVFTRINGGLGGNIVGSQSECHAWGDFDNDGDLDFYRVGWQNGSIASPNDAIFVNNGTTFDLGWERPGDEQNGRGATICDFDEDGDVDVYVSNYVVQENNLFINDGYGNFIDEAVGYGVAADPCICEAGDPYTDEYLGGFTIASAWGDLDNDGHFDLVVGNFAHSYPCNDRPQFYRNMGPGGSWHFEDKTAAVGLPYVESHASPALADYDNDGDLDVFITAVSGANYTGQKSTLMRNDGNWNFTDVSVGEGLDLATPNTNFQAAWADYDNDGDLDLFTGRKLYQNNQSTGNHWLKVKLRGYGMLVNSYAVGAQVRINKGGGVVLTRQVESATGWGNQNDMNLHFGLGSDANDVDLEVFWPNGDIQVVSDVVVDQQVTVVQQLTSEQYVGDDIVVYRPDLTSTRDWRASNTLADPNYFNDPCGVTDFNEMVVNSTFSNWGLPSSKSLMGDVNGDGNEDVAVYHSNGAFGYAFVAAHTTDSAGVGSIDNTTTSSAGFPPKYAGVDLNPVGAWLVDINGDGYDDALLADSGFNWYVCYSDSNGLVAGVDDEVQFGLGNGLDTPIVGDFNGDGYVDIGVMREPGYNWLVLRSNSSGFGAGPHVTGQFGNAEFEVAITGDINGDGRTDGVLVDTNDPAGMEWLGCYADANGIIQWGTDPNPPYLPTYTNRARFGLSSTSEVRDDIPLLADFNGDGLDDIAVKGINLVSGLIEWHVGFTVDDGGGQVTLYTWDADETARDSANFGEIGRDIAVIGNLDSGDDRDDIVLYRFNPGEASWFGSRTRKSPQYMHNATDTYQMALTPMTSFDPMMGDVNGDGIDDIVVVMPNGASTEKSRWMAYNSTVNADGVGSFGDTVSSSIGAYVLASAILDTFLGDVNGDGAEDAIIVRSDNYNWLAAHSVPGSGLDDTVKNLGVQFGLTGDVPLVGDFNGDGFVDISVWRPSTGGIFVARSDASGIKSSDQPPSGSWGGAGWEYQFVGDFNGDGRDDLILVDSNDSEGAAPANTDGLLYWAVAYADPNGSIGMVGGSPAGGASYARFGLNSSDIPFVADDNRDGRADIGVRRVSGLSWIHYVGFSTETGLTTSTGADDTGVFGRVDFADTIINAVVLGNEACPISDLSGDCAVDLVDFAYIAEAYLESYDLDDVEVLADQWLLDCTLTPTDADCIL